jgi:hypothetical protein
MSKKMWLVSSNPKKKSLVSESIKLDLKNKADQLITASLGPKYILPPPSTHDFNYLTELHTKWHGSKFYFCALYHCPSPHAIAPSFETKFARMDYVSNGRFNLFYMRHTGQWFEVESHWTMEQCLMEIQNNELFIP